MRAISVLAAALAAGGLWGCGGPTRFMRGGGEVRPLMVREVAWNPGHAEVGRVAAVADSGEETLVLGDRGAMFLTGGSVLAADRRITAWRGAAAIPAADRQATWLTALDAEGRLYRVKARSTLEAISDRYGVAERQVTGLAALGGGLLALAVEGFLAVADGRAVTLLSQGPTGQGPTGALAGGGGKAAWIHGAEVHLFDSKRRASSAFALPGALFAALDAAGRLYAATPHEVYAEDGTGALALVYETATPATSITGLVISGERVWFAEGAELGVVLERQVSVTTGLVRSSKATLAASPSGDVWSLAEGALSRFAVDAGSARRSQWDKDVLPVFERACAACHGPSAPSGVDLSTMGAWESSAAAIRRRVIEKRDMPPAGRPLDDAGRRSIDAWTAPLPEP